MILHVTLANENEVLIDQNFGPEYSFEYQYGNDNKIAYLIISSVEAPARVEDILLHNIQAKQREEQEQYEFQVLNDQDELHDTEK